MIVFSDPRLALHDRNPKMESWPSKDDEESEKDMGNVDDSEAELSDFSGLENAIDCFIDLRDKSHPTHDKCDNHLVWRAVAKNRPDVIQRLIEEKKSICIGAKSGRTVLHLAIAFGHVECMVILLNEGVCDVDGQGIDGNTPLLDACENLWSGSFSNPMDHGGLKPYYNACTH